MAVHILSFSLNITDFFFQHARARLVGLSAFHLTAKIADGMNF